MFIECKQSTYGLECNNTCGNCRKGESCNHVNGSCLNGCDVGVYGDKCDIGKNSNLHTFCRVLGWKNRIKNVIEKEMAFYIKIRIYI